MDFSIADAGSGAVAGIERLEKLCFSVPWTAEQIISQLPDENHFFITAVDSGGSVLGYVGAMLAADEGYISNVAVDPALRRQGIGGALIEKLVSMAAERGLAFLTLEARASNAPALALYEKYGFRPVGRRKNYYEKPREDAILMTLFLK